MWGSIYSELSGTGFTMEFIGDVHDSTLGGVGNSSFSDMCTDIATNCTPRPARGIN